MDTPYWEQLQYAGDSRLQMLISYAVSGDPRLAEQAIDAFAASDVDGGIMESAYPTRNSAVIAPFSLMWIGMLDDWRMREPDPAPVTRNLPRMRRVLDWWAAHRVASGLQGTNDTWNFIDWAGQSATDRKLFPSFGKDGESCLLSVLWLGGLQQASSIEQTLGDPARGEADAKAADAVRTAIRQRCWIPDKGLYADNPDGQVFSQHMNALAVLYDVATPAEASGILGRIVAAGKGINAPQGMYTTSYYFAWYLAQSFVPAGMAERYLDLLQTWRDLLKLNYTTWPEERDTATASTRSDTHAWSAHPTADLLGVVAGIGPGSPGYGSVRIAPALGSLHSVDATAATPAGPIHVRLRRTGDKLKAIVDKPGKLPGFIEWRGQRRSLPTTHAAVILG